MRLLIKVLLPILVIAACVSIAYVAINNRPEPQTRPQFKSTTSIDATRVSRSDYQVTLQTQGTVAAARQGSLVPQVAGAISRVAPNFVVGGAFRAGDVLVEIDPRDFEIAVTLAEATFAQSRAALAEEQARADQAQADWKRLGRSGTPSELTLRKPQLAAARASLEGARAQVERARLDLDRSRITASYDGIIREKFVDLGQYVNRGTVLAEIYSTGSAEIRLPLNNQQLGFVDLNSSTDTPVILSASVAGAKHEWQATLTRTDGAIDPTNRQLFAIAEVTNPFPVASDQAPLRIGQFVQAAVTGKTLNDVFVIPRSALREDREVLIVDALNTLQTRAVEVIWKDADVAVINEGLTEGDVLSLTALGSVTNGTRVRATIDGEAPPSERPTASRSGDRQNSGQTTGQTTGENGAQSNGPGSEQTARLERLRQRVEAGESLPPPVVARFKARLEAGQPVPQWMRDYLANN